MSGVQGAMLRSSIHFQAEACQTGGRVGSKQNVARMLVGVYPGAAHNRSLQRSAIPRMLKQNQSSY